jgi:hypothetical protein
LVNFEFYYLFIAGMDAVRSESLNHAILNRAAPLRVVCRRSIHEVDEALWDSLNARQDLFHTPAIRA